MGHKNMRAYQFNGLQVAGKTFNKVSKSVFYVTCRQFPISTDLSYPYAVQICLQTEWQQTLRLVLGNSAYFMNCHCSLNSYEPKTGCLEKTWTCHRGLND